MAFIYYLISYGIVFGAIFNQLPQIYKIHQTKSVEGISFQAIYTETFMLIFNVAYNLHEGTDFMLYGENVILYIEYIIVLLLFSVYEKVDQKFIMKMGLLLLLSALFLLNIMPILLFKMSIYINMILLFCSKWPQIQMNYRRQSTGQLAFLTHLQNQAGAIPRALSIFSESNNYLLYCLMGLDNILIMIITIQFILYWKYNKKIEKQKY